MREGMGPEIDLVVGVVGVEVVVVAGGVGLLWFRGAGGGNFGL